MKKPDIWEKGEDNGVDSGSCYGKGSRNGKRKGRGNKLQGQLTVFMALCAGLILTVIMAEIETARYTAVCAVQKMAAMTACRSLLAEYNIPLYEWYSVFGIDGNGRDLSETLREKVMDNSGTGLFNADVENVCVTDLCAVSDEDYAPLKKEIIQYMKTAGYLDGARNLLNAQAQNEVQSVQSDKNKMLVQIGSSQSQSENKKAEYEAREAAKKEAEGELDSGQDGHAQKPSLPAEDPRKTLTELLKSGILSLVLPEGTEVSSSALEMSGQTTPYVSQTPDFMSADSVQSKMDSVQFKISGMMTEKGEDAVIFLYMKKKFKNAVSSSHIGHATKLSYELEYILCGHQSDSTNLLDTVNRLVLLRTVFNFSYLLKDAGKTASAHTMAANIAASVLMPWLEPVIYTLLLAAWAYGESVLDVRLLFSGGSVPLLKNASEWQLSLDHLSVLGKRTSGENQAGDSGRGLSYEDYLMVLFMFSGQSAMLARMADLMEADIRTEPGYSVFSLQNCFYSIGCIEEYKIRPVFSVFYGAGLKKKEVYQWSECY